MPESGQSQTTAMGQLRSLNQGFEPHGHTSRDQAADRRRVVRRADAASIGAGDSMVTSASASVAERRQAIDLLARPERFELPTPWFVARYSIQLSYGRVSR
jgi:hypothetical protein